MEPRNPIRTILSMPTFSSFLMMVGCESKSRVDRQAPASLNEVLCPDLLVIVVLLTAILIVLSAVVAIWIAIARNRFGGRRGRLGRCFRVYEG